MLDQAVSYLHTVVDSSGGEPATPYIDESLRPDLYGGPSYGSTSPGLEKRMAEGDPLAKREFDAPPA